MLRRSFIACAVATSSALATGCGAIAGARRRSCAVCRRQVHEDAGAVALAAGRRVTLCCPACAFSAQFQGANRTRLIEVTDHQNHRLINAASAIYVIGGDAHSACARNSAVLDEAKHPNPAVFDRCAPAITAFASKTAAATYASIHGGRIASYPDLARLAAAARSH